MSSNKHFHSGHEPPRAWVISRDIRLTNCPKDAICWSVIRTDGPLTESAPITSAFWPKQWSAYTAQTIRMFFIVNREFAFARIVKVPPQTISCYVTFTCQLRYPCLANHPVGLLARHEGQTSFAHCRTGEGRLRTGLASAH